MPSHACIDPQDQYAQAEVRVAFEPMDGGVRLISALDTFDEDILPDLEDVQRRALEREILDDCLQSGRCDLATGGLVPVETVEAVSDETASDWMT